MALENITLPRPATLVVRRRRPQQRYGWVCLAVVANGYTVQPQPWWDVQYPHQWIVGRHKTWELWGRQSSRE